MGQVANYVWGKAWFIPLEQSSPRQPFSHWHWSGAMHRPCTHSMVQRAVDEKHIRDAAWVSFSAHQSVFLKWDYIIFTLVKDFYVFTYGHICFCFHNSLDSTGTSCDTLFLLLVCRQSCRWSLNKKRINRKLGPSTIRNRKSEKNRKWFSTADTCGANICKPSGGQSKPLLSPGHKDVNRTPSLRWWNWKKVS